nr:hypothetical protein Itr_chr04CG00710 [Ipomoea trifida]
MEMLHGLISSGTIRPMFILSSSSGISRRTNLAVTIVITTRGSCHEIWHIMETASKAAGQGIEGHPVAFITTKHGFLSPMLESLEHKLRLVLHHSQYIRARLARDSTRDTETMRAIALRNTHNARATEQVVESSKRLFVGPTQEHPQIVSTTIRATSVASQIMEEQT